MVFFFVEVADTLRREHSVSQGTIVKGYTQTFIPPRKDQDQRQQPVEPGDQEILSESPGRRKEKPRLPRDRPPAPPLEPPKTETHSDIRPPLPLPNRHGAPPLPALPVELSSTTSSHGNASLSRPQLPLPQMKKSKEKSKNDKRKNVQDTEPSNNENQLPPHRSGSISLNELSRGLGALKSVKGPPSPVDRVDGVNQSYRKEVENQPDMHQQKIDRPLPKRPMPPRPSNVTRNQRHAVVFDDDPLESEEKKHTLKESEQKPIPAPRKTVRKPIVPGISAQLDPQRKPLPPPKKPLIPVGGKPVLNEKKPQLSTKIVKKPRIKQVVINTASLKSELLPVAEELQNLYRTACDIITLTEARVSDNMKSKSEECSNIASSLLDCLSAYRDSLGPVTRMKVNNHITKLEECNSELKSLSSELPSSPNAVELSRLGKVIIAFVDVIETLSNYLPSL